MVRRELTSTRRRNSLVKHNLLCKLSCAPIFFSFAVTFLPVFLLLADAIRASEI